MSETAPPAFENVELPNAMSVPHIASEELGESAKLGKIVTSGRVKIRLFLFLRLLVHLLHEIGAAASRSIDLESEHLR